MITSKQNTKIQYFCKLISQKKERDESECFAIEGIRLTEEAYLRGVKFRFALYTTPQSERAETLLQKLAHQGIEIEEIMPDLLKFAADTQTPQGLLAVAEKPIFALPKKCDFIVISDGIQDPGNLGTLCRSAAAAGVQLILTAPNCADLYSPKVIRSTMGVHFNIPAFAQSWGEIRQTLSQYENMRVFAADSDSGISCWESDFRPPTALIIGSESAGLCADALKLADSHIFIPMPGGAESLNAAVAAGILLFEVVRQRC